jgi:hypothetical protein
VVDEGRPVEPDQLVVEHPPEPEGQGRLAQRQLGPEGEGRALGLGVEGDRGRERFAPGGGEGGLVDLEVDGVDDDLGGRLDHLDRHGLVPGERGGVEVGLEGEVVAARDDRTGEPVGVLG